ncbi:MAG: prepilin-type N-terminal cleavage/methylation domain-containing protein [Pelomonas sp.]|nr:prepilin-type N-terminal cleavage/methylation domain-containing protein [Roseateles sp.]
MKPLARRGTTLVELLVALAIGLLVVAGAGVLLLAQLAEQRHLTRETELHQDLRAAADLMLRETRRAGFWGAAERSVWMPGAPAPPRNPYATDPPCRLASGAEQFAYAYANPAAAAEERLDASQVFGWRVADGVLQFMLGCANGAPNWQPLTDPDTLRLGAPTALRVVVTALDLSAYCSRPCPVDGGVAADCPRVELRRVEIALRGAAVHDAAPEPTLGLALHQRNARVRGACPP